MAKWLGPRRQLRIDQYARRTGGSYRYEHMCDGNEFVASGMEEGVREGYERLDELPAG